MSGPNFDLYPDGKAQSGLDTKEQIVEQLREGMDGNQLLSLHRKLVYAFGDGESNTVPDTVDGSAFPVFADIARRVFKKGSSQRIMQALYIAISRMRSSEATADWPQVNKFNSESRKQAFLARARPDSDGEWNEEITQGFQDGYQLGFGGVQAGLVTDRETGLQRVSMNHRAATATIRDRNQRNPTKSQYIGYIHQMPAAEASVKFGRDFVERHVTQQRGSMPGPERHIVPVCELFSLGYGGGEPTHCFIPGGLDEEPVNVEANPFGRLLPQAWFVGFLPNGLRDPVGLIDMQIQSQAALNDLEAHVRRRVNQKDFLFIDPSQLQTADVTDLESSVGGNVKVIRTKLPQGRGIEYIQAPDLSRATQMLIEMVERQYAQDSGLSEVDRSVQSTGQRTKFEVNQLVQRSDSNRAAVLFQTTNYLRRVIELTMHIGGMYDQAPLPIDVFGHNVLINDPDDPAMSFASMMAEESRAVVTSDALTADDDRSKRDSRKGDLGWLFEITNGAIATSPKFMEEALRAINETEPGEWLEGMAQDEQEPVPA